jgi:tRNA nucleotidyltransferase (CCA-adding enzyme)
MALRNLALRPIELPETMEIRLTEKEDQLCTLLDECTTWMRAEKGLNTSCRIAGGWVRDKVLDISLQSVQVLTCCSC